MPVKLKFIFSYGTTVAVSNVRITVAFFEMRTTKHNLTYAITQYELYTYIYAYVCTYIRILPHKRTHTRIHTHTSYTTATRVTPVTAGLMSIHWRRISATNSTMMPFGLPVVIHTLTADENIIRNDSNLFVFFSFFDKIYAVVL